MSRKSFRDIFFENIIAFLWRQWSAIGVLGESRTEDNWVLDPEPMLLFTLEIGRYEPRLFDEVIDWLIINNKWIDIQRLRGILREQNEMTLRLMGATALFLSKAGNERKWKNLSRYCQQHIRVSQDNIEPLFIRESGKIHPYSKEPDPSFFSCGFNRPQLKVRRMTRQVPITSYRTLRFLLRALFGVGSRSECLAFLLTHDGGHPSEVAKAIGISIRGAQDALIELSRSNLILTRVKGKRKIEYWLSHERWWEFLSRGSITEIKKPVWIDWIALYSALSKVWATISEVSKDNLSDYMRSSKLRDLLELVGGEFAKSGLDIPPLPGSNVRPDEYEKAFETFIVSIFGAK